MPFHLNGPSLWLILRIGLRWLGGFWLLTSAPRCLLEGGSAEHPALLFLYFLPFVIADAGWITVLLSARDNRIQDVHLFRK
ncbi:hypothetical protein D3C80_956320 [compost metagenome]